MDRIFMAAWVTEGSIVAALRILEHEAQVQDTAVTAAQKYLELAITRHQDA